MVTNIEEENRNQVILPDEVEDFLSSFDNFNFVRSLVKDCPNSKDAASEVLAHQSRFVRGTLTIEEIISLSSLVGVVEEHRNQFLIQFIIGCLLPIQEWITTDLTKMLTNIGADPKTFQDVKRIHVTKPPEPEPLSPVAEALKESGAVLQDPVMQHRLELIVSSFHSAVRTREQAVAVLMRSVKTGGLEMSETAARDVLAIAEARVPMTAITTPQQPLLEKEGRTGKDNIDSNQVSSISPLLFKEGSGVVNGVRGTDTLTEADEAEVQKIAVDKKHIIESPQLITDTKVAAQKIVAEAKIVFASGELKTRFEHLIDARLRDVRDGYETREKLEASVDAGGVGLSGAQLVTVMEMVENMDAMHHKALEAGLQVKKEQGITAKTEKLVQAERNKEQEAQVMSKRYAEITGVAPTEHVEIISGVTTAAVKPAQVVQQREQTIDTAKVKAAIEAGKAPAPTVTPVMSVATIPTTSTGRPKVEDIRFERKLAGPVEELEMLTLSDFRRLSKDPHQAALKVQDKVNIATHEGYNNHVAAIKAWRASPLSAMYIALSREALTSGKGITDLLAEKRSAGEDVMSNAELDVIVELNGILRL